VLLRKGVPGLPPILTPRAGAPLVELPLVESPPASLTDVRPPPLRSRVVDEPPPPSSTVVDVSPAANVDLLHIFPSRVVPAGHDRSQPVAANTRRIPRLHAT
jgi:hypothetical protein